MRRQADDFRVGQVRQLRTSTGRFENLLSEVSNAVFSYLYTVYSNEIDNKIGNKENEYA